VRVHHVGSGKVRELFGVGEDRLLLVASDRISAYDAILAQAIAETLFGDNKPSGKLPISYPRGVGQIPVYYGHKLSGGRSHWHGDYVDMPTSPRYAFGHGLTYTTFTVEKAGVARTEVVAGESLDVEAVVANTGPQAGEDVIQLYVRDPQASITRPVLELKSFARVSAAAGERTTVRFRLPTGQLGFYNQDMAYTVEAGTIELHLGFASDALMHAGTATIFAAPHDRPVSQAYGGSVVIEPPATRA
jgi:beta-glucosidase